MQYGANYGHSAHARPTQTLTSVDPYWEGRDDSQVWTRGGGCVLWLLSQRQLGGAGSGAGSSGGNIPLVSGAGELEKAIRLKERVEAEFSERDGTVGE